MILRDQRYGDNALQVGEGILSGIISATNPTPVVAAPVAVAPNYTPLIMLGGGALLLVLLLK